VGKVGD